jgi:hypothetical protein
LSVLLMCGVAVVLHAQQAGQTPRLRQVVAVTGLPGPAVSWSYLEARFLLDPAPGVMVHPALPPLDQAGFAHGH